MGTRVTDACFGILEMRKKGGRDGMSSAMRFDILIAHGVHDTAFGIYSDVSWCKRWVSGYVFGLGHQQNDCMGD